MTRDDIIRMAREAGCLGPGKGGDPNGLWEPNGHENVTELMVRFAALVAAAELRRLHAENEKFRKHIEGQNDELDKLIPMAERLEAENECLHQIVAQRDALLEALKTVVKEFKKHGRQHWPEAVKAQAAIDKVEVQ